MKLNSSVRAILLSSFLFVFYNFLEYGLIWDSLPKIIYPFLLSITTVINLFVPKVRRFTLIVSMTLFVIMIIFYLAGQIIFAGLIGSIGLAIFICMMIGLMPTIFRKGYIEKI